MQDLDPVGAHWSITSNLCRLGRARVAVNDLLETVGVGVEARERTVLATDELLANAVEHADGDAVVLSVCVTRRSVRVAVTDQSPLDFAASWRPAARTSGLTLVWQLSRSLYARPLDDGKSVVAEVARPEAGPGDTRWWSLVESP